MNKQVTRTILIFFTALSAFWLMLYSPVKEKAAGSLTALLPVYITDSIYLSAANPFSADKAELGHYLFYDRRISFNRTKSCASCHDPAYSFTDGYRRSIGAMGDAQQRNAAPLINIIFCKYLTAADSSLHFPEQQINQPLFHDHPVELGWKGNEPVILKRLRQDSFYVRKMRSVFPGEQEAVNVKNIQYCITSFVKTIVSFQSAYDRYTYAKDSNALSRSAQNGMQLFFSDSLACSKCHGGSIFSTPLLRQADGIINFYYNTGLYNTDGKGAYPSTDQGLFSFTHNPAEMGKFKVPTLRNLAFTAPYFHDGSAATLEEVINIYENGGRVTATGPDAGDGRNSPLKDPLIKGFHLSLRQHSDLVHFLLSLSDSSVCKNPLFTNPFDDDETRK